MKNRVSRKEAILHDRKVDLIVNVSDYIINELSIPEKTAEIISEIIVENKKIVISILGKNKQ